MKSVDDFLAQRGLLTESGAIARHRAMYDPFVAELRELAERGATLALLMDYLWLNHQVKVKSKGSFSEWLIRQGIGTSARVIGQPASRVPKAATASQTPSTAPRRRPMPVAAPVTPLFGKAAPVTGHGPGFVPGSRRFESPGMPLSAKPASNAELDAIVEAAMAGANEKSLDALGWAATNKAPKV